MCVHWQATSTVPSGSSDTSTANHLWQLSVKLAGVLEASAVRVVKPCKPKFLTEFLRLATDALAVAMVSTSSCSQ